MEKKIRKSVITQLAAYKSLDGLKGPVVDGLAIEDDMELCLLNSYSFKLLLRRVAQEKGVVAGTKIKITVEPVS